MTQNVKLVLGGDSFRIVDSCYPYATRCSPSLALAQGKWKPVEILYVCVCEHAFARQLLGETVSVCNSK